MAKKFKGVIKKDIRDSKPDWEPFKPAQAPKDAPNVLYVVWDDVGLATFEAFGGEVKTPTMSRIAKMGLRYTQWHTTALCSPTRSCLLTGRNAHMNGMAIITEATAGFPGRNGHIPLENGTLAEVLLENGYNTYAIGKWHLTPSEEYNMAATKTGWPLGRGFERYYGFLGGETNQWYPDLVYDNHQVEQPEEPEEGYHLSKDITDKAIEFIQDSKQIAPEKPFFMYYCPGAGHAPHQVPKEWADKYKGKFDDGYEKYRQRVIKRMKKAGVVQENADLPDINPMKKGRYAEADTVKPWNSLSKDEKKLFSRMAEVYAGFISYTDAQIGRLIDHLKDSDQLDNTIIVVVSDNGASGEGSPDGTVNENKFFNSWPDSLEENLAKIDKLGGPETYNHMPTGWAAAFNTPFKMFKRYSYNGGLSDPLIIAWPKKIKSKGDVRDQYHHAIDIMPTMLDCIGIKMPSELKGHKQSELQGVSMRYSFNDKSSKSRRKTQYYEMLGQRSIYHDGWKAVTDRGPTPINLGFKDDKWELYHVEKDRSELNDLASKYPEKLKKLVKLFEEEAKKNNVYPLDDRTAVDIFNVKRPTTARARDSYIYYPNTSDVPEVEAVNIRNRSYDIKARVNIEDRKANGVLLAHGSRFGGHSLFIKNEKLHYIYNFLGIDKQNIVSNTKVPLGKVTFGVKFDKEKEEPKSVAHGTLSLLINNKKVGSRKIRLQPGPFGLAGEGLTIGRDSADPVSSKYKAGGKFVGGTIEKVVVNVSGKEQRDPEKEARAALKRD